MDVEVDMDAGEVRAIRTVRQSGNSMVVSLPPNLLAACGFSAGDDLQLVADNRSSEIRIRTPPTNESDE